MLAVAIIPATAGPARTLLNTPHSPRSATLRLRTAGARCRETTNSP